MSLKLPYLTEPELQSWLLDLTADPATANLTSSTNSAPTPTPNILTPTKSLNNLPNPAKSLNNLPTAIHAKIITA
jgi:hypothetical protein